MAADGDAPGGSSSPTDLPPPPPRVATRAHDAGGAPPGRLLAALSVQREPEGAGGVPAGVTDVGREGRESGSPRDAEFEFKDLDTGRAMTVRQVRWDDDRGGGRGRRGGAVLARRARTFAAHALPPAPHSVTRSGT